MRPSQLGTYAFRDSFQLCVDDLKNFRACCKRMKDASTAVFFSCLVVWRGQSRISSNSRNASSSGQCASCSHSYPSSQDTIIERPVHFICKEIRRFWSEASSRVSDSYLTFRDGDVQASIANCITTCHGWSKKFEFSDVSICIFTLVSRLNGN